MKLSPQKEIIVGILRDMQWHCGSEWLNRIKDDRIRITELNRGYMKDKGYEIIGDKCDGRCGNKKCPLFMRRAIKIEYLNHAKELVRRFDAGEPVFSVV
jgi:hypothetical protein